MLVLDIFDPDAERYRHDGGELSGDAVHAILVESDGEPSSNPSPCWCNHEAT